MKRALTRLLSPVIAISMFLMIMVTPAFADRGTEKYPKSYTIPNVLTDFQYFVKGNFTGGGHVVGAVAVGGVFDKSNAISDGQITPSYIYDVKQANIGTGNYYDGDKTVFYGINSSGNTLEDKFIQNEGYINMNSAFAALSANSAAIASSPTKTYTASDIDNNVPSIYGAAVLNVDVTDGDILIPWGVYSQIDVINLIGFGDADYFKTNPVNISVTGVPADRTVNLSFSYGSSGKGGTAYVFWNGESSDQFIKGMTGGTNADELNLEGLKLVWNFPDAKTLNVSSLSGHLVAPNADISIYKSGRFEGGMIAKNMLDDNNAEAHFYTYNNPEDPEDPTDPTDPEDPDDPSDPSDPNNPDDPSDPNNPDGPTIYDVSFVKASSTNPPVALEGALFGLYSDSACTTAIKSSDGSNYTVKSGSDGIVKFSGLTTGTYYFKELEAPAGYQILDTIFSVTITLDEQDNVIVTFGDGTNTGLDELAVINDPITGEGDPNNPDENDDSTKPEDPDNPSDPDQPNKPSDTDEKDNTIGGDPTDNDTSNPKTGKPISGLILPSMMMAAALFGVKKTRK